MDIHHSLPSIIGHLLDDGSSQLTYFQYNEIGKPTSVTDPAGRTTLFTYDSTNEIDLLQVQQAVGSSNDTLFSATYNSQHLPLTVTDAAGQTSYFGYNTNGQILAATNALNQIVNLYYDTNGFLTNVTGPAPQTSPL